MSRLREEGGFTLAELLVGSMLMIIVMSATLLVLDHMTTMSARTDRRVDVQDAARTASRQVARSLRNLAASPDRPGVVERDGAYDLVFRMVDKPRASGANDRNLRRVRYCLDAEDPDRAKLWEQTQRWDSPTSPSIPSDPGCPGVGWEGEAKLVADRVTNRANGLERPLWTYGQATLGQIASVKLNLFMNSDPAARPREVGLHTGVFLRNQNRSPTAAFTATEVGTQHVLLNGSASYDPEGQPLDFHWLVDGVEVGRGLVYDFYAQAPGQRTISLEVFDTGGLSSRSASQTVVFE